MLNHVVPSEICKMGFKIFPSGFVIEGFYIEDPSINEEDTPVYEMTIKVLN